MMADDARVEHDPAPRPAAASPDEQAWDLVLPRRATGVVVLFSGPATGAAPDETMQAVAGALHGARVGTVAVNRVPDDRADADHEHRFEIGRMADKLVAALDRLARERGTRTLPVGCVATGTAGAAALRVAAERHGLRAVVVLEGRPDLAGPVLERVMAPTLLVVAGRDTPLLRLNHQALRRLKGPAMLAVVPGAMHGLDEPKAREMAVPRMVDWLCTHLGVREPARGGTAFGDVEHLLIFTR
jgi:putative phosphoribosyl transferase